MIEQRIGVKIVGNHPHSGDTGYFKVVDGKVDTRRFGDNAAMVRVELEFCQHDNTSACYAERKNLELDAAGLKAFREIVGRNPYMLTKL